MPPAAPTTEATRAAELLRRPVFLREGRFRILELSPLAEALERADDYGFQVVSMKRDWRSVFS
jgi:hypothetical protein